MGLAANPRESQAEAPGKILLAGEYAVLKGSPCLVLASDRQLQLKMKPLESIQGIDVISYGYRASNGTLSWNREQLQPDQPEQAFLARLLNALLDGWAGRSEFRRSGWQITIDSRQLYWQGQKLGLGSSAALTVALARALDHCLETQTWLSDASEENWLRLHKAHSLAQRKEGSGADIAASLHGGLVQFQRDGSSARIRPGQLPSGLHLALLWSGASASTPDFLRRLDQWQQRDPECFTARMQGLTQACQSLLDTHQAQGFLEQLAHFTEQLRQFAQDSQLDIFANGHGQLDILATDYPGLVYKPTGAGGGDLGLAISTSLSQLQSFIQQADKSGYPQIGGLNTLPQEQRTENETAG